MTNKDRLRFSGRQVIAAHACKLKVKSKSFAAGEGAGVVTLQGYPIVFAKTGVAGTTSDDRGGYVVQIPNDAKMKFTTPTMALFHHQFASVLGTTANNSLRIGEPDDTGVPIELDLNTDTTIGSDVAAWVARGDVAGMSFSMANGFEDYDIEEGDGGLDIVTVNKFTVDEVTITPIPAMSATTIDTKEASPASTMPVDPTSYSKRIDASLKLRKLTLDTLVMR